MAFDYTTEERAELLRCCQLFEGTRHLQRRCKPGHGVDCVQLVIAVLQSGGALPIFKWPQYRQDIGWRLGRNQLGDIFRQAFHASSIAIEDWEMREGDVAIFKAGRVSNHCGIFVAGRLWHVTVDRPVHSCHVSAVKPHLQEIIRLEGRGLREDPSDLKTT